MVVYMVLFNISLFEICVFKLTVYVIQALDRVYKVTFMDDELYSMSRMRMEYNSSAVNVILYTLSRACITIMLWCIAFLFNKKEEFLLSTIQAENTEIN